MKDVLVRARGQAGFDQRRLAHVAGTARTTIVAYETGARSPTVRQLTRLLAACGLRARVVLEPLTADLDEVLDAASAAGTPEGLGQLGALVESWSAAGVRWALDGVSAVSVHGVALPHHEPAVVLVDDDASRLWLRRQFTMVWDPDGFSSAPHWYESREELERYTRRPVYTVLGFLQLRLVESLPEGVLAVQLDERVVPVLPLGEVRRVHPRLDELLQRHAERQPRTV